MVTSQEVLFIGGVERLQDGEVLIELGEGQAQGGGGVWFGAMDIEKRVLGGGHDF